MKKVLLLVVFCASVSGCAVRRVPESVSDVTTYASPKDAIAALLTSAASDDLNALRPVVGVGIVEFLRDEDRVSLDLRKRAILDLAKEEIIVETTPVDQKTLGKIFFGTGRFPFPLSLVEMGGRWSFDEISSLDELLARRFVRNGREAVLNLAKLRAAQEQYRAVDWDSDGKLEFAPRIAGSAIGQGLFWTDPAVEPILPVRAALAEGRPSDNPEPIAGYAFRILMSKGPAAVGGQGSYVAEGSGDISGYAAVAYPIAYGRSGRSTFLMDYTGQIFRADLGVGTSTEVEVMDRFNPDDRWTPFLAPVG
jgi:hypothetical protein